MSDFFRGDLFDLDENDPEYEKLLEEKLSGTYSEGWATFRRGVASTILHGANATRTVLNTFERIKEKSGSQAEAAFLMEFNYTVSLLGPCLSSVLLGAMAVESFLRLGFLLALERPRTKESRRRGLDSIMISKLSAFDEMSIAGKIDQLTTQLTCRRLSKAAVIRNEVIQLVRYRNECVHDTPILTLGVGSFTKLDTRTRTSTRVKKKLHGYERFGLSMRPVRLTHVVRAIEAHDNLVTFLFDQVANAPWKDDMLAVSGGWWGEGLISKGLIASVPWGEIRTLAKRWEEGPERFVSGVPLQEMRQFGQALRRRATLKVT